MGEAPQVATSHAVLPQRVKRRRGATTDATDQRDSQTKRESRGDEQGDARAAIAPQSATRSAEQRRSPATSHPHLDTIRVLLDDVRMSCEQAARQFEYLDHTADVQLHAWGRTLQESFEQVALCMFNYMTPLEGIESGLRQKLVEYEKPKEDGSPEKRGDRMADERPAGLAELAGDPEVVRVVKVEEANDIHSLMFHWLDEFLFGFNTEYFVPVRIRVVDFHANKEGGFGITGVAVGGVFDAQRDVCGTEIKAITYSAMQVLDVCTDATAGDAGEQAGSSGRMTPSDRSDVYVIVDI